MNKIEKEKKWTVISDGWMENVYASYTIVQGYLARDPDVRVRIETHGDFSQGYLIVKGRRYDGDCRDEFMYEIPTHEAERLLSLCQGQIIAKTRYLVNAYDKDTKKRFTPAKRKFEVDVFNNPPGQETICEMEYYDNIDDVMIPDWIGEEVTGDERFYNHTIGAPVIN